MLLIGSQALKYHIYLNRKCKDYDVICTHDEFQTWIKGQQNILACYPTNNGKKIIVKTHENIYEFEIAWENSTAKQLLDFQGFCKYKYIDDLNLDCYVASLNILYTIKMSHRFKKNSPHFLKTMRDIWLMRQWGAKIPEYLQNWFKLREKETYNYSHPKLNQSKKDFFDPGQGVKYVYDHDSIHECMKHLDRPAYTYFKENQAEVKCSKQTFYSVSEEIRLYSVLEESYVLALERSQIPFKGLIEPKRSFLIALEKVCTSISSGWWREYAWEHYDEVLELYDEKYTEQFWNAVDNNLVKSYV